jgi:hypothetical protein
MPTPKNLRSFADIVEERIGAEDSADPLVQRFDDLLVRLAEGRDQAAALPDLRAIRAKGAMGGNTVRVSLEAMRGGADVDPATLNRAATAQGDADRATYARSALTNLADAITDAMRTPTMSHEQQREAFVRHLHLWGHTMWVSVTEAQTAKEIQALATSTALDFSERQSRVWPLVAGRLEKHLPRLADLFVAMRPGRRKTGHGGGPGAPAQQADLLKAVGLEGSANTLRSAKRRRKKKAAAST